jgi:tRNA1(Val) A37 N6-methylase TrmN6
LRLLPSLLPPGGFSCCISNPPYFTSGPRSRTVPLARREDACSMEELFCAAAWGLKYGGDFFLVHRPERFAELCACASRHGMEVKRVCLLRHNPGVLPSLTLVQCRKGAKPGLTWEEVCLQNQDGTPTNYYKNLYHI